jgi:hypothetical protein
VIQELEKESAPPSMAVKEADASIIKLLEQAEKCSNAAAATLKVCAANTQE